MTRTAIMMRTMVHTNDGPRRGGLAAAWLAALWVALASLCMPVRAAEDPPGRVGRVTEGQGQSWFYDGESGEWVSLERNRPLTSGDRIAVDGAGRLELRIGSTAVRLAGGSELEINRIDDARIDLFLHSGSAAVRVRSPEVARGVEVATLEGRFSPRGAGHFRVDRRDDSSVGTAWSGELQFDGDDSALAIPAGRAAELWREGANNATHYSWSEPQRDEFADWTARASREDDRLAAPDYVSPEMTGAEDLDRHGRWDMNPDYGPIWTPYTVVAGWAPYRYGHWIMVQPWGWTWVDYAPWGFAPFHYGRWLFLGGRWCWAPGQRIAHPVYSPAMVAWIGGGPSARGPWPYVGWVPLAPHEPYYPHYTTGGSYWRAINSAQMNLFPSNTPRRLPTSPTLYANQGVAGAVSVVPGNALVPRRPIAPVVAQVDPGVRNDFANQPWRTHVPPPGLARPIAVPGVAVPGATPGGPPRSPAQPTLPRPPGQQPSPAVMAQPGTPPATTGPDWRRDRGPRAVPAPPITRVPGTPPATSARPVAPPPQGNAVAPVPQPRAALPGRPNAPAVPQSPAAPATPAPPVQAPAPAVQQPAPVAPGRGGPGDPAGSRRSGAPGQPPQARAIAAPPPAAGPSPMPPVARPPERVSVPHPPAAQQEAQQHPSDHSAAGNEARVRVPEGQGRPSRAQMQ
jgi:uncharacterized protein DUF6600